MLKQQHYTLTNVKKVKSQSTTPLKRRMYTKVQFVFFKRITTVNSAGFNGEVFMTGRYGGLMRRVEERLCAILPCNRMLFLSLKGCLTPPGLRQTPAEMWSESSRPAWARYSADTLPPEHPVCCSPVYTHTHTHGRGLDR